MSRFLLVIASAPDLQLPPKQILGVHKQLGSGIVVVALLKERAMPLVCHDKTRAYFIDSAQDRGQGEPEGEQVADEVDAEVDVPADRQMLQMTEVWVHAAAAHWNGGCPSELKAPQPWRYCPVCYEPSHLQKMNSLQGRVLNLHTREESCSIWLQTAQEYCSFPGLHSAGDPALPAIIQATCRHGVRCLQG